MVKILWLVFNTTYPPFYSAILWLFLVVCAIESYQKERKNNKCIRYCYYAHLVLYFMYCSTSRVMFCSQSVSLAGDGAERDVHQAEWTQATISLYFVTSTMKHFQIHPKRCRGKSWFLFALIWGLLVFLFPFNWVVYGVFFTHILSTYTHILASFH